MDAITYSLSQLYLTIPRELLNEVFKPSLNLRSLDGIIKEKIIVGIVLPACNLYSGKIKKVRLLSSYAIPTTDIGTFYPASSCNYTYFKVPKEVTENRKIIHALDIGYPMESYANFGFASSIGGNTIESMAATALSSFTESPQTLVPVPIVMDDNIIRLDPPQLSFTEWILSCMLEYDSNFTNVYPNMYEAISEMVRYATESYIYNDLIMKIDHAELVGGRNLGVMKNIVEEYKGSYEKYKEALKVFRGEAVFDKDNIIDLLSLLNV